MPYCKHIASTETRDVPLPAQGTGWERMIEVGGIHIESEHSFVDGRLVNDVAHDMISITGRAENASKIYQEEPFSVSLFITFSVL